MTIIPEPDVCRLIAKSKLPSAEKFEKWVFEDVLLGRAKTGDADVLDFGNIKLIKAGGAAVFMVITTVN